MHLCGLGVDSWCVRTFQVHLPPGLKWTPTSHGRGFWLHEEPLFLVCSSNQLGKSDKGLILLNPKVTCLGKLTHPNGHQPGSSPGWMLDALTSLLPSPALEYKWGCLHCYFPHPWQTSQAACCARLCVMECIHTHSSFFWVLRTERGLDESEVGHAPKWERQKVCEFPA